MKFKVSRTSGSNGKPCDKAYRDIVLRHDERTVSSPDELYNERTKEEGYTNGFNHRVVNNHIIRDFEEEDWVVDIPNLESLIKFVDEHGEIVVSGEEIEIYDDYRE